MLRPTFWIAVCLLQPIFVSLTNYRLPTSLKPEHYKIEVITHLGDDGGFKFFGKVWIKINCVKDTKNITLHSLNLDINTKKLVVNELTENGNKSMFVKNTVFDTERDFLIIYTMEKLKKGQTYELHIPFEAELNQGLVGYYRSSYVDQETQKRRWITITQFEAATARRAFPCFDEPEMKAKFEISLGHERKYTALSNMPVKKTIDMKGKTDWVWSHFQVTVPMSTYLVAYSINDFEYKESAVKKSGDVLFKIWARRDALDQVEYAKDIGPKVLKFYESYFDIKFPLPKVDMIAIPDFSAGAMENWGLVTYRETALLYSSNVSSTSSQHKVSSTIAHELAHQWFGNLVTMKWWEDLWLNEGFATYISSLGVEYLHPEWNSYQEESVANILAIFKLDALKSSHTVSVPINNPSETITDQIIYKKGSSIIRMMHLFLGKETFRRGLIKYLNKYKYGNAEQDNLWECLTQEAHNEGSLKKSLTVKQIMDTWTLQTGYPVVTVNRNYEKRTATVSQKRYLTDTVHVRSDTDHCWWVPLSYTTAHQLDFNNTRPKSWLTCKCNDTNVAIPETLADLPDETEWVVFNVKMSGLYKVQYDQKNWELLITQLSGTQYNNIDTMNRAQLIDDVLDLAWTGDQDYSVALRLVDYLKHETEYIPWKSALDNLGDIDRIMKRSAHYGHFKKYLQSLLEPIYKTVGGLTMGKKADDPLAAVEHKVLVASWSCRFSVGDCESKSKQLFKDWMNVQQPDKENPVPLDVRSVVYCTAIGSGGEKEWNFLWKRYAGSNVGAEKIMILSSLGCSSEIWMLQRYLDWSLDESSGVRKQDSNKVFSSIATSGIGFYLAKEFLMDRIDDIYKFLQPDTSQLEKYIKPLTNQMITANEYNEWKSFVDKHATIFEKASKGVKQSLETVEINLQWQAKNYKSIGRILKQKTQQ